MKWTERVLFFLLMALVISCTVILGRRTWVLKEEQNDFRILAQKIEEGSRAEGNGNGEYAAWNLPTVTDVKSREELILVRTEENIIDKYQPLYQENPDFAGWISIEGTTINYPVMQTQKEPEYYIHRDFSKRPSYAGTPFIGSGDLKEGNTDCFIYGHNMRNGTMFADLLHYREEDYWREHPVINLDTLWEHREYEIFMAFDAGEEEWAQEEGRLYQAAYGDEKAKDEAIMTLKEKEMYDTEITPKPGMPLLYLVTCSYGKEGKRYVVAGVLK